MVVASAVELEDRVKQMAEYYFDGFQACLSGILGNAGFYLEDSKRRYKAQAEDMFGQIEKFYERINLEYATLNEMNGSLLVVKLLLSQFRTTFTRFFNNPNRQNFDEFVEFLKTISKVGYIFGEKFHDDLFALKKQPGHENFRVEVYHPQGKRLYPFS